MFIFQLWYKGMLFPLGSPCPSTAFECKGSSTCILLKYRCDGVHDCDDGSDEDDCPKKSRAQSATSTKTSSSKTTSTKGKTISSFRCPNNLYTCKNEECVISTARCDGTRHCSDGSDEQGCKKDKNGKTIPEVGGLLVCSIV